MTDKTSLGDRMKIYESVEKYVLPHRMPVILRIDGKAFHTFTKGFTRPFDFKLQDCMTAAATALMKQVQGAQVAYIQSDEISILLNNYKRFNSSAWFDNKVQKICSVSASIATAAFNREMSKFPLHDLPWSDYKDAMFDSRCFTVPHNEVVNYFTWRQRDAIKNSVSMVAQTYFSHKELQGKNGNEMKTMLQDIDKSWDKVSSDRRRGWCVIRNQTQVNDTVRNIIQVDRNIPIFGEDRNYIEQYTKQVEE